MVNQVRYSVVTDKHDKCMTANIYLIYNKAMQLKKVHWSVQIFPENNRFKTCVPVDYRYPTFI